MLLSAGKRYFVIKSLLMRDFTCHFIFYASCIMKCKINTFFAYHANMRLKIKTINGLFNLSSPSTQILVIDIVSQPTTQLLLFTVIVKISLISCIS